MLWKQSGWFQQTRHVTPYLLQGQTQLDTKVLFSRNVQSSPQHVLNPRGWPASLRFTFAPGKALCHKRTTTYCTWNMSDICWLPGMGEQMVFCKTMNLECVRHLSRLKVGVTQRLKKKTFPNYPWNTHPKNNRFAEQICTLETFHLGDRKIAQISSLGKVFRVAYFRSTGEPLSGEVESCIGISSH